MSLWLSERKTAGLWAGGLWRSQQGSPYAFNLDLSTFKDTVTGRSLSCNIDGTRYDEVNGVTTAFGTDVPTICDKGLRICGAYSNYICYSSIFTNWTSSGELDVVQNGNYYTITKTSTTSTRHIRLGVAATAFMISLKQGTVGRVTIGVYNGGFLPVLVKVISGSGVLIGTPDANGYYSIAGPVTITGLDSNDTIIEIISPRTVSFYIYPDGSSSTTIGASVNIKHAMAEQTTKWKRVYLPNNTGSLLSSCSEAGNSSTGTGIWIDDVATNFPLLNTALTSQGTLTLKWKPGFNDADVSGNLNILSFDGTTDSAISYDADNNLIKITDGTNTASKALTVVADTEYTIQATWGLVSGSPKMQIAVNGTAGTQAAFAGTFNPSDIYFGLENEELQYICKNPDGHDLTVLKVATWL